MNNFAYCEVAVIDLRNKCLGKEMGRIPVWRADELFPVIPVIAGVPVVVLEFILDTLDACKSRCQILRVAVVV